MAKRSLQELQFDQFLAQAELLAQLAELPAWGAWTTLVRDMRTAALESLAEAPADEVRYWQGVVGALAEVLERPGRIIDTAEEYKATEPVKAGVPGELRAIVGAGYDPDGDV